MRPMRRRRRSSSHSRSPPPGGGTPPDDHIYVVGADQRDGRRCGLSRDGDGKLEPDVALTIDAASASVCTINRSGQLHRRRHLHDRCEPRRRWTYAPAAQAQQSFPVAAAGGATPQTIAFTSTPPANATVGGPTYVAIATATSNLPRGADYRCRLQCCLHYQREHGDVYWNRHMRDRREPGRQCGLCASCARTADVCRRWRWRRTQQTITFTSTAPVNATVGVPATSRWRRRRPNSPVTLTIDVISSAVCTINDGTVSFIGAGTCTIDETRVATQHMRPPLRSSSPSLLRPRRRDAADDLVHLGATDQREGRLARRIPQSLLRPSGLAGVITIDAASTPSARSTMAR